MSEEKQYPEFEQQHIVTLKGVSKWSQYDREMHLKHNRILQSGYGTLSPQQYIELALVTKEEWLTDVICPQVSHACKLNIAADLITQFKISAENLNDKTQQIFLWVNDNQPDFLIKIENQINLHLKNNQDEIAKNALLNMQTKYPDLDPDNNSKVLQAFLTLEIERVKKKITHDILGEKLQSVYPLVMNNVDLKYKSVHKAGTNNDYSFLGAAGSGKSTITRQFLNEEEKLDYVVLATDDYRGVSLDETHDQIITDQIFIRTQDSAYSIKELVQHRIEAKKTRPNVILDCVSLESWHKKLLAGNSHTVSAVACLNDISLVPGRAYLRALDEKSGPADKGRHVHTPSLLSGHASASARLLTSIPPLVRTTLYDTNVAKGQQPDIMGYIDTTDGKHQIEVISLAKFSEFLAKANANVEATFKGELYRDLKKEMYRFTFDPQYQAAELLKLIKASPETDNFDVILNDTNGNTYAKIKFEKNELKLEVIDTSAFLDVLNNNDNNSKILKNIAMQIHWKDMDKARENSRILGKSTAEKVAITSLVPQIGYIPSKERAGSKNNFRIISPPTPSSKTTSKGNIKNGPLTAFFNSASSYSVHFSPKTSDKEEKRENVVNTSAPNKRKDLKN
ncbi:MAG: hypothetical protein BGO43_02385 [Gammaproteobacteria bacterium 39-13]|nr:hypothetical protein [Gammaproteobacteria bacterium]OJV91137.1 MAG: hypothetical protein BGO43_02385 [Gammaproteobacteria bacterium 39-13]